MSNSHINGIFSALSAEEIKKTILSLIEQYFPIMEEAQKQDFMIKLLGTSGNDKLSSMVNR